MAFELKDGQGTLFKNDKGDNEKRPDYRGEILIGGELLELSAWIKEGKKGKFMSLSAKPKQGKPAPKGQQSRPDPDDEVPF